MRPLLPEAGGTIAAVERWGPSAIERKLMALERRRAKLVPMLAMHRMSAARRARLRQQLANVDEMIRLMKRTGLPDPPGGRSRPNAAKRRKINDRMLELDGCLSK